jgi:nucleotide-binding universal stress UspA family protein
MNRSSAPSHPKKIMLATDLSCRCDRALDRAAACAVDWQAELVVTTVIDDQALTDAWTCQGPTAIEDEARLQLIGDLTAKGLEPMVKVRSGNVVDEVLAVAEAEQVDLVITGVARDRWLRAAVLGTVVDALMRRSEVPNLVVRNRVKGSYTRILVAGDLTDLARKILRKTLEWFPAAEVILFHAVEVPNAQLADAGAALCEAASEAVRPQLVAFVDQAGLTPNQWSRVRIVCEPGRPLTALNGCLRREAIDLVVVGAHRRGLLFEILIGSKAKQIVENIPTDVLIVRGPDEG